MKHKVASSLLLLVAAAWGASFVLMKDVLSRQSVNSFLFYRFAVATIALLIIHPKILKKLNWDIIKHGGITGAFLGAGFITQTYGLDWTGAAITGFITGLYVVATPLFEQFFGGHNPFHHHRQQQQRKNKDLRVNLTISLGETLEEQHRTISVQTTKNDRFNIEVVIPRGVNNGTTIKYAGQGDNFFESLTRGDLYVIINVIPVAGFEILGNNLLTNLTVNSVEAMVGVDRTVTGIDGKVYSVKIPAACQPDTS